MIFRGGGGVVLGRELSDFTASVVLWHTRLRLIFASLFVSRFCHVQNEARTAYSSNFSPNEISFPHNPNARSAVNEAWEDGHEAHAHELMLAVFSFTYSATVRTLRIL